ncbi:MAG: hypothetical protein ACRDY0_00265 [Acidimicrobiales bacterium]
MPEAQEPATADQASDLPPELSPELNKEMERVMHGEPTTEHEQLDDYPAPQPEDYTGGEDAAVEGPIPGLLPGEEPAK